MGEVAQALGAIKQAKAAIGSNGADQSDPGISLPEPTQASPQFADMSQFGQSQAMPDMSSIYGTPSGSGLNVMDLLAPSQAQQPTAQQPVDNPYTPYDNNQNPAANIGSQDDAPITVTADDYKPSHHEGWLGKTLDVLLMLRGRQPVFKQRKDEENIQDAMKTYWSHPEEAIKHVAMTDPNVAVQLDQHHQQTEQLKAAAAANQQLAQSRLVDLQNDGRSLLANSTGFLLQSKNPGPAYQKLLPTLRAAAIDHGFTEDQVKDMLPDQFDPDKIGLLRSQGMNVYQQEALKESQQTHDEAEADRQERINLAKASLGVETYNAETSRLSENNRARALDQGTQAQRAALYGKVLGGASAVPWLYGGFMKGIFGSGSNGLPQPGVSYVSPDKSMALKMTADGTWNVYHINKIDKKGVANATLVKQLPGVNAIAGSATSGNSDFDN